VRVWLSICPSQMHSMNTAVYWDRIHSRSINRYSRAVKSQNSHKVISSALWDTVLSVHVWEGQTLPSRCLCRKNLPLLIKRTTVHAHRSFCSDPKSSYGLLFLSATIIAPMETVRIDKQRTDADCSVLSFFALSSLVTFLDELIRTWNEDLFRSVSFKPNSEIKLWGIL
jgi:hypothetical protein